MSKTRQITLCEGAVSDLDAVMVVMRDSFDPAFGEAWTAPQCSGLLPMPGVWLTLARDEGEGEVIGFALGRLVIREAELLLLAVRSDRQGEGIGILLVDGFTVNALRRGADRMHLEVRDGNHAVNLYKRAGFHEVGRRKSYYRGPDGKVYDALTLSKDAKNNAQ
ncbi:MAG: family N-acetyltransferase [Alphaproteobacteria bacterium]|nr:family N-acetyltransferase [Alphaproteobacteria bacterium]